MIEEKWTLEDQVRRYGETCAWCKINFSENRFAWGSKKVACYNCRNYADAIKCQAEDDPYKSKK